jgi:hypothetical protein
MMNSPGNNNSGSLPGIPMNRGTPVYGNNSSPPSLPSPGFPLQVAFDLTNNMKRKDLFNQRKQREFIPDNKKDDSYWDRRRRNNEAAKRSREKRRFNDMILEQRVIELTKETHILKAQLIAIKDKFGINGDNLISLEQVLATLPSNDQVLSLTKRGKSYPSDYIGSPSDDYQDGECGRDNMDSDEQNYPQHGMHDERSRSPSMGHHHMVGMVHPHGQLHSPHIDIEKVDDRHPMYNNHCPDNYSPNSQPPHPGNMCNNRSSLSPSEDILNLSISCNSHAVKSMDHDDHSDAEEFRGVSRPQVKTIGIPMEPRVEIKEKTVRSKGSLKQEHRVIVGNNNINNNNGAGSNLPPKFRHKNHGGDKEVIQYPYGLKPGPQTSPPCTQWEDDTNSGSGSSDERDSGISINGEGPDKFASNSRQPSPLSAYKRGSSPEEPEDSTGSSQRKRAKKRFLEESLLETENSQLKSELARLATEVACLQSFLIKKPTCPNGPTNNDDNSCDSSG